MTAGTLSSSFGRQRSFRRSEAKYHTRSIFQSRFSPIPTAPTILQTEKTRLPRSRNSVYLANFIVRTVHRRTKHVAMIGTVKDSNYSHDDF
jgi:hypothetical protein